MANRFPEVNTSFVDRFPELHRIGYRASFAVLGHRLDAEDCAQEAMARTLAKWSRVQSYAPAFTARAATNLAIDRTRRAGRTVVRDGATLESLGRQVDPALHRRRDLVVALGNLPKRQREAVALRYLNDMSESETAAAMGCTIGTVKSTTAKALVALRRDLGPGWAWED